VERQPTSGRLDVGGARHGFAEQRGDTATLDQPLLVYLNHVGKPTSSVYLRQLREPRPHRLTVAQRCGLASPNAGTEAQLRDPPSVVADKASVPVAEHRRSNAAPASGPIGGTGTATRFTKW
jgi:hypothetical protein